MQFYILTCDLVLQQVKEDREEREEREKIEDREIDRDREDRKEDGSEIQGFVNRNTV